MVEVDLPLPGTDDTPLPTLLSGMGKSGEGGGHEIQEVCDAGGRTKPSISCTVGRKRERSEKTRTIRVEATTQAPQDRPVVIQNGNTDTSRRVIHPGASPTPSAIPQHIDPNKTNADFATSYAGLPPAGPGQITSLPHSVLYLFAVDAPSNSLSPPAPCGVNQSGSPRPSPSLTCWRKKQECRRNPCRRSWAGTETWHPRQSRTLP